MNSVIKIVGIAALIAGLQACDDGKAENFGEEVDKAYENTKDAVGDAADDAGDAMEDACEKATDENC
ncbi:hypothetical protein WKI13_04765 [Teredinibacter turnerae]|uniref:miaB n=1 Tax=Teredinibacter turnerae TaxID=2426 RepID=UPI0003686784|nr:miaB [Teredinibacter turnerae]